MTTATEDQRRRILRFAYDQSYNKQVDTDRRNRTAPYWTPDGACRVRLPAQLDPGRGGPDPGSDGRVRWEQAVRQLVIAGQVVRREPSNPYNDHRPYPSSASQFSTHLWLSWGSPPAVWHYNPLEHAVEGSAQAPAPGPAGGYRILVAADYREIDGGYGTLRYALAMLEAGHCLYNLAAVAAALGLDHRVRLWFDDAALLAELGPGLGEAVGWIPAAVIEVGSPPPAATAGITKASPATDELGAVDRLGWAPRPAHAPDRLAVAGPDVPDLRSLSTLLYERNSGRGMLGVTGRSGALPGQVLRAGIGAMRSVQGGDPPVPAAATRQFVAVQDVQGHPDGLYEVGPRGEPELRRSGRVFADIQQAYSYPASVMTIESFHLVFFLVVDYPSVTAGVGPRGFRLAQLQLGWTAQAIGLALATHDCFSRPVRAYLEWRLDDLLALRPTETVAYQVLGSRNHLRDVVFDLRI